MQTVWATEADLSSFDPAKISFGPLQKPESGHSKPSRVSIRYGDTQHVMKLQSNMWELPFKFDSENGSNSSLCFSTTSRCNNNEKYRKMLCQTIRSIQEKVYDHVSEKAAEYGIKGVSRENFSAPLKDATANYVEQCRVKFYKGQDSLPQFSVYDGKTGKEIHSREKPGKDIDCADIFAVNTCHIVIIEIANIWILGSRFGVTARLSDDLYHAPLSSFPFKNTEEVFEVENIGDYSEAIRLDEEEQVECPVEC